MRVSVVGIANVERVVPVPAWPIAYEPVRYVPGAIRERVAGVGFNVARGLAGLGDDVALTAPLGSDPSALAVRAEADRCGVSLRAVIAASTPRSVVLTAPDGSRMINTDLGDALTARVNESALLVDDRPADVAVLGNLDLSRPLLTLAQDSGIRTVVDLQAIRGLDNPYDQDFLAAAHVLVMSHEHVPGDPTGFLAEVLTRSRARYVVLGMGARGSLAWERDAPAPVQTPADELPPGTDTTGAGDSLVAGFVHFALGRQLPLAHAMAQATRHATRFLEHRRTPPAAPDSTP